MPLTVGLIVFMQSAWAVSYTLLQALTWWLNAETAVTWLHQHLIYYWNSYGGLLSFIIITLQGTRLNNPWNSHWPSSVLAIDNQYCRTSKLWVFRLFSQRADSSPSADSQSGLLHIILVFCIFSNILKVMDLKINSHTFTIHSISKEKIPLFYLFSWILFYRSAMENYGNGHCLHFSATVVN